MYNFESMIHFFRPEKKLLLHVILPALMVASLISGFGSTADSQTATQSPAPSRWPQFCGLENGGRACPISEKSPKNIVYIMLDDADYFDFSFNNHHLKEGDARTPNIDSLRNAGRLMTRFYTASCICSPTRISVLTGCSPVRFGALDTWPSVRTVNQGQPGTQGLPSDIPHMGVVMRGLGKRTGHFGKWHVGLNREKYRPASMGFDEFTTYQNTKKVVAWSGKFLFHSRTGTVEKDVDYIDRYFTDEVLGFIDRNKDSQNGFFINFCPLTPHYPWTPPRNFDNSKYGFDLSIKRGKLLGMMQTIDQEIGRIVEKLKSINQLDDTLLLITSDNGGQRMVQNLERWQKGCKGNFLEGGVHVPLVAHWPNGIAPNTSNETVMTTYDLMPTFVEMLGGDPTEIESKIDGRSKAISLVGDAQLSHAPILWEISGGPKRTKNEQAQRTYAMRTGPYKIVKVEGRTFPVTKNALMIYNMDTDPREIKNLNTDKELTKKLYSELQSMRWQWSRLDGFPDTASDKVVIPFDPRFDIGTRDMHLSLKVKVPRTVATARLIYKNGRTQKATLNSRRQVEWTVLGATPKGKPVAMTLRSDPLSPDVHSLVLSVGGFKSDPSRLELIVDGKVVDQSDRFKSQMHALWSDHAEATVGDKDLELGDIRFHLTKFWPNETPN